MFYVIASFIILTSVCAKSIDNGTYYDTFTGKAITMEQYQKTIKDNNTFWCTGKLTKCDPNEGRRMDGSCNNLKYPTRGAPHTPFVSELPLIFPKDSGSTEELDARKVRTATLINGVIPDQKFTILLVHYILYGFAGSLFDTANFVMWKHYCCAPQGKNDSQCHPISIRSDDHVHQFSNIRCFNNTKPITFHSAGCIRDKTIKPGRINSADNFLELQVVYGHDNSFRAFKDGLLNYEEENGKIWPQQMSKATVCFQNQPPREKRCHVSPVMNSLFGLNFFGIIFWRHHNYIANRLKELNPCWDDEKLFSTARDINIAHYNQIFYYEMLPPMIGKKTLVSEDLNSFDGGFRKTYQENLQPKQILEYNYILRWLHTIQPGHIEMYDNSGNYLNKIPVTNMTLRTGFLALDRNIEEITQGSFRQPAAKFDHVVDPILSETGLSGFQRAFDIPTADLSKAELYGLQSYTAYRKLCTGNSYTSFGDLKVDMIDENIEILTKLFKRVEDVPLMVGIWLEKKIPGGEVPRTFACLMFKQLKRFIQYDRHWYENPDRPNAYTKLQLREIRKATVARMLCDVGDEVTHIQPQAFLREGITNGITSCSNIPKVDFSVWKDSSCI